MSSFPTVPAVLSPDATFPWQDVARLCRRVCLLRAQGRIEDAESLRAGELAAVVAAHGRGECSDDLDARIAQLFATEEERVANASVLAELLAPLLAQAGLASPAISRPTTERPATRPATVAPSSKAPGRPGDIADFIDEMLAQERPAAPLGRAS